MKLFKTNSNLIFCCLIVSFMVWGRFLLAS